VTISVRNPAIHISPPRLPRVAPRAAASAVAAASAAVRAVRRTTAAPDDYRYALTRFDVVFDRATEPADDADVTQRIDRKVGALCLSIGLGIVVVTMVALAFLIHGMLALSAGILG
jgi:hypothetical protein